MKKNRDNHSLHLTYLTEQNDKSKKVRSRFTLGHNITKNKKWKVGWMSSLIKNCGVKNDDVPDFDAYVVWVLFVLLGLLLSVKEKMQIIMAGEKVGEIRYC